MIERRWYLGSMNDGLFIIDAKPRPSTDDQVHDRRDGPTVVLNATGLSNDKAQAIADAHNDSVSRLETALRAVLLFHSASTWDDEKRTVWRSMTGAEEATTKSLCDAIRKVIG